MGNNFFTSNFSHFGTPSMHFTLKSHQMTNLAKIWDKMKKKHYYYYSKVWNSSAARLLILGNFVVKNRLILHINLNNSAERLSNLGKISPKFLKMSTQHPYSISTTIPHFRVSTYFSQIVNSDF